MNGLARVAASVALVSLVAAPAAGQDPLARRVSLDLKAMAPAEAFKVLADAVDLTVTVDPAVTVPVDIVVRHVKARTALDTICDSIDCRWTLTGRAIAVTPSSSVMLATSDRAGGRGGRSASAQRLDALQESFKRPLPADLRFENAALPEVAERLSQATGLAIRFDGEGVSTTRVTLDAGHRTLMSVLQRVSGQSGARIICRVGVKTSGTEPIPEIAISIHAGPPRKDVAKSVKK